MRSRSLALASILISFMAGSGSAHALDWTVNPDKSFVQFSGTESGNAFTGKIGAFQSVVSFDPNDAEHSSALLTFSMESAKTGTATYDGALSGSEWLNVAKFPEATFTCTSFTKDKEGEYTVHGTFKLLGIEKKLDLPFHFTQGADKVATVDASFPLKRLEYGIGQAADAKAEWVSDAITVTVHLEASPKS